MGGKIDRHEDDSDTLTMEEIFVYMENKIIAILHCKNKKKLAKI